jgi:hypothetical protein
VLSSIDNPNKKGIFMVKPTTTRPRLEVTAGDQRIVNHVGARLVADVAEVVGLRAALSAAMAPTKRRRGGHDRGRVLVDLAVALADGGETISDLAVLGDQPALFGDVASSSTAWRTLDAVGPGQLDAIAAARAEARARAWALGADPGFYVVDLDATLVNSHSDKECAAGNYKGGFGFYPLVAYLDATGEALAAKLRPGNAGSGDAADHVEVLDAALAQLPLDPQEAEVIARADSAGCSHGFLDACRERHVRFVVGAPLTQEVAKVLVKVPRGRWETAISADGSDTCEGREVAEVTDLLDLSGWPVGTRAIVRREEPHPGAQLTFTDVDGHRYQLLLTDHPSTDIGFLEALYRGRGRCEQRIADAKDTGLANFPSHRFAINEAWMTEVLIAQDLLVWTRLLALDGELAVAEPKRVRYTLLHVAGVLARSGRRTRLRLAASWPWTPQLVAAFGRVHALPLRT